MESLGKLLVILGGLQVGIGLMLMFFDRNPLLGKLPGDITIKRDNVQIFIPITSGILLSVLISVIVWIYSYFKGR
jgi:hypothetical protein